MSGTAYNRQPAFCQLLTVAAAAACIVCFGPSRCNGGMLLNRVLQTLIRCSFSPVHTTGQRYIISGSQCGAVFMWDTITGERVLQQKRTSASGSSSSGSSGSSSSASRSSALPQQSRLHHDTIRDVAWHPYLPLIASSSWDCSEVIVTCRSDVSFVLTLLLLLTTTVLDCGHIKAHHDHSLGAAQYSGTIAVSRVVVSLLQQQRL
eukprot:12923-Heterococcus_DN1.PRE.4